jgi:hypothetical protein
MRRMAAGFAVLVPAGWFVLLGIVYWLTWAATVRRAVVALGVPAAIGRLEHGRVA